MGEEIFDDEMSDDEIYQRMMQLGSRPGGYTIYPESLQASQPPLDPSIASGASAQDDLEQLLTSSARRSPDAGLSTQQQFASVITSLLPLAIAAASGGGSRRLGAGAQSGLAAGTDYLTNARQEAEERRKQEQTLGMLGIKSKLDKETELAKRKADLEFLPKKEKIKQDAVLERKKGEKAAGISSGTRVSIQNMMPLAEQGPPLEDADLDIYGRDPAVMQQINNYKAKSGRNPNLAITEKMAKHGKTPPSVKEQLVEGDSLIDRVDTMVKDFDQIKDKPSLQRFISSQLPDFVPAGADERTFDAGLEMLSLQVAAIFNGGRPSEKDAQAIKEALAQSYTTGEAGQAKLRRFGAAMKLAHENTKAAYGWRQPLAPEEKDQLLNDLSLFGLNDAVGSVGRVPSAGKSSTPTPIQPALSFEEWRARKAEGTL